MVAFLRLAVRNRPDGLSSTALNVGHKTSLFSDDTNDCGLDSAGLSYKIFWGELLRRF